MFTLIAVIILILSCGLFAGLEIGCFTVNKVRLQYLISKKDQDAKLLSLNLKDPQIFVFTMLIFQNLFNYMSASYVTNYYLKTGVAGEKLTLLYNFIPWSAEIVATLTLLFPLFIFAEISPKNLFRIKADVLMYKFVRLQKLCIFICKPLTVSLKFLSSLTSGESETAFTHDLQNLTGQKLKFIFSESRREGTISAHQNAMINNILGIHLIKVTKMMKPLYKIVSLPAEDSSSKYENIARTNNYNFFPVYSRSKDNVIGIVSYFDVMTATENKNYAIRDHTTKIISVKWSDNIQQAFYKLQSNKQILALVKNKKNKAIGIVFLRDIVKQITTPGQK